MSIQFSGLSLGATAQTLIAGDLDAIFLPAHGMLGTSLRHKGVEMLRRVEDLDGAAANGSTAGIPLLHPWANRLGTTRYRAAGQEVNLDPLRRHCSHFDASGLPMHGVPWPLCLPGTWTKFGRISSRPGSIGTAANGSLFFPFVTALKWRRHCAPMA